MATSAPSSLDKIFSQRDLFRGRARLAWVWSILAVLLLLPFVMVCGLFSGLMIERGRLSVELSRDDVPRFTQLTGLPAGIGATKPVPVNLQTDERTSEGKLPEVEQAAPSENFVHVNFDEYGILPAVWHSRHQWWGRGLAWLFRRFEWLQSNVLATISLLVTGVLLATARAWCLARHRRECLRAALEAVSAPRRNLHRQVLRLGPEDLDGTGVRLAERLFTTETEDVRRGLAVWIERDTRYPLELACLVAVVLSIQPLLAAQTLLLGGATWYILDTNRRQSEQRRRLAADRAAGELRAMVDDFRAARLVRGLGIEQSQHDQFASQLLRHHDLAVQEDSATEIATHPRTLIVFATCIVAAFLLFLLAMKVLMLQGELTAAAGGTFVVAWVLAIAAVKALRQRMTARHDAAVAAENIHRYLEQIPAVGQAVGAKFFQPLDRTLHFDSLTYRLPNGRALLEGLDLKLEAGRTYSLISVDPLEARALVSLMPRFIEPQQGRVLFDGEDIAWATLESLRAETVFVGADDPTLAGSVLDNLRGGRGEYTLQQVTDAAKTTHAHNFIVKLFNGYETVLTGGGDSLEPGQRFRLALARAVLRNPAVLIIEEPRENLDDDTKSLLADAYDRICVNRTVFFLPGRLSTVRRSDEVIVLHEGRVAAIGPQSRLVNLSTIYRHWEYLNFNEFRSQE
ncbi:MAG: ABC transporter ATP-binding protein [Planctomycetota bacterium]